MHSILDRRTVDYNGQLQRLAFSVSSIHAWILQTVSTSTASPNPFPLFHLSLRPWGLAFFHVSLSHTTHLSFPPPSYLSSPIRLVSATPLCSFPSISPPLACSPTQHGFKETGVVNIAEPVMFELAGQEENKEVQQTKGVGNLLNMDTFSALRHLRNRVTGLVSSSCHVKSSRKTTKKPQDFCARARDESGAATWECRVGFVCVPMVVHTLTHSHNKTCCVFGIFGMRNVEHRGMFVGKGLCRNSRKEQRAPYTCSRSRFLYHFVQGCYFAVGLLHLALARRDPFAVVAVVLAHIWACQRHVFFCTGCYTDGRFIAEISRAICVQDSRGIYDTSSRISHLRSFALAHGGEEAATHQSGFRMQTLALFTGWLTFWGVQDHLALRHAPLGLCHTCACSYTYVYT